MQPFNPILLKLVRQSLGESQKEFAEKVLGARQALLSKYENGVIVPPPDAMARLAAGTGYPQAFFCQDAMELPSGLVFHRKRNSLSARLRERIESEVRLRALDVLAASKAIGLYSDLPKRSSRSPEQMAQFLRATWGLGDAPIPNLVALLEKHDIVVLKLDFGTELLDAFFMPLPSHVTCIALNSAPVFSADRQRFSLAHELGHALLHQEQLPDDRLEKEANAFAAEFLFPRAQAIQEAEPKLSLLRLKELKGKWRISMQAILFRWHKLGLMEDKVYRRYCVFFSSQGFRKHEPPCGVVEEAPTLLPRLMREFLNKSNASPLAALCLSRSQFAARYPELAAEEGELM